MTRGWGIGLALSTATISGFAIFINGFAVRRFPAGDTYTTAKNLVAAVLLAALIPLAARFDPAEGWTPPHGAFERAALVTVGIIGGGIPFILFFEGLSRASSTDAAFIHKTLVVWVALGAVLFLRERLGPAHLAAITLLVIGQALLADDLGAMEIASGEMMIVGATLCWSVEVLVAKRLLRRLSPATVGGARMIIGAAVLVTWLAATGDPGDLGSLDPYQWAWAALGGLVLTGYVATWYSALARAQAVDVTAVLVAGAIVTAVLDAGFKHAPLRPDLAGLALMLAGAAVLVASQARRGARAAA